MAQENSGAAIQALIRNSLLQGVDQTAPISSDMHASPSALVGETGDPFRNSNGQFVSISDINVCEDDALCGE